MRGFQDQIPLAGKIVSAGLRRTVRIFLNALKLTLPAHGSSHLAMYLHPHRNVLALHAAMLGRISEQARFVLLNC